MVTVRKEARRVVISLDRAGVPTEFKFQKVTCAMGFALEETIQEKA